LPEIRQLENTQELCITLGIKFKSEKLLGNATLECKHEGAEAYATLEENMLAQQKFEELSTPQIDAGLHDGQAVEAFTTSLQAGSDMTLGEGVEMMTTSLAPVATSDAQSGEAVEAFTTSLGPVLTGDALGGDSVEAFTTSLSPKVVSLTAEGDLVQAFTTSL